MKIPRFFNKLIIYFCVLVALRDWVFSMYDWWFLVVFDIIPLFFLLVTIKITSFIQKQSKSTKISTKLENHRIMSKNHQKTKHSHIQDIFDDFLMIFWWFFYPRHKTCQNFRWKHHHSWISHPIVLIDQSGYPTF